MKRKWSIVLAALCLIPAVPGPAAADDIASSWSTVGMPSAPPLRTVKIEPQRTAMLVLDFDRNICNETKRPRCLASIATVASMLSQARSHGVTIIYSKVTAGSAGSVPTELAGRPGEPVVSAGVDKFLGTELADMLRVKAIQTVIVVGTSAHGAVLYTASEAALRGFQTIVPVDGMSADDPFAELAAAWILTNAPASVSSHIVLSRSSMISY